MSRAKSAFFEVTVRSREPSFRTYAEDPSFAGLLRAPLERQGVAGVRAMRPDRVYPALVEQLRGLGPAESLRLLYRCGFERKARQLAAIERNLDGGSLEPARGLELDSIGQDWVWLHQNLVRTIYPEVPGIERTEVALTLRALTTKTPVPAKSITYHRAFASRILRDRASPENLWSRTFDPAQMDARTWRGEQVQRAIIEDRTPRSGILRVILEEPWARHLVVGETFESSATP